MSIATPIDVTPVWSSLSPASRTKVRVLLQEQLAAAMAAAPPDQELVTGIRSALAELNRSIDIPPLGG